MEREPSWHRVLRGGVCAVCSLAMSVMLLPAFAQAPSAEAAPETTVRAAQGKASPVVSKKLAISKSGTKVCLESGDKATLKLKSFSARSVKSSKRKVASAKRSGSSIRVVAKKAGTARITAMRGRKTCTIVITVKKEGALTVSVGSTKTIKLKNLKSAKSLDKTVATVKKTGSSFTVGPKKAASFVVSASNRKGARFLYLMSGRKAAAAPETPSAPKTVSADTAVKNVRAYGFVDLEGAKVSAIVLEYDRPVLASSVGTDTYEVSDYTTLQEAANGYDATIEVDGDSIEGNEGAIQDVYVNDEAATSRKGGTTEGRYVIIEVNTDYMLKAQNLVYTESMAAGARQVKSIQGLDSTIAPASAETKNYEAKQELNQWSGKMQTVITVDPDLIILPQLTERAGWHIYKGENGFDATDCYSEYTGKKESFKFPYAVYIPDETVLEKSIANGGKGVALDIHIEHAGANSDDPMASLTSSQAATDLSGSLVQGKTPAIIIVPQVEESRRVSNDYVATSECNPGIWEIIDYYIGDSPYAKYIDKDRIYGTGQSMGGMTLLDMAAQRDNFFAGFSIIGAQWSNSYDKSYQNGGQNRSPENDPVSFTSKYANDGHFNTDYSKNVDQDNWYYQVSDDNLLILNCIGDPMAYGLVEDMSEYYEAAGVEIPHETWSPYLVTAKQDAMVKKLVGESVVGAENPGGNIHWGTFTEGNHMSTWKYAYNLNYTYTWLFQQNRQTELARGKVKSLNDEYQGRDSSGKLIAAGTRHMNSAQFTPHGADPAFTEGWTPEKIDGYKASAAGIDAKIAALTAQSGKDEVQAVVDEYGAAGAAVQKFVTKVSDLKKLAESVGIEF